VKAIRIEDPGTRLPREPVATGVHDHAIGEAADPLSVGMTDEKKSALGHVSGGEVVDPTGL